MAQGQITKHVAENGAVSWRVRSEEVDPVTGSRKRPMKTFKTKREAEGYLCQRHTDLERGVAVDNNKQTVSEYLQAWMSGHRDHVRPSTYAMYRYHVHHYILPDLGAVLLQRLTPVRLKAHIDAAKTPNIGKVTLRVLHVAFEEAVHLGVLASNIVERVKPPRTPKPKRSAWDAEQSMRFLQVAADDAYQPVWLLCLYAGLRRGESLGLRWQDVDLDAGSIRIVQQIIDVEGKSTPEDSKTESGKRVIDLPPHMVETLRAHRVRQGEHRVTTSVWHDHDLVCTANNGQPIGPRNVDRRFQEIRERAGLPYLTLHGLRHSAASIMLAAGAQLHEVSEILGHSTPSTTATIYAHALRERKKEATHLLSNALQGGQPKIP